VIVMSQIWLPAGAADTRSVEDQFLDLLLADDELLRAEFDAIIAAEWPSPPSTTSPRRGAAHRHPGQPYTHRRGGAPVAGAVARPRHPGIGGWARQRSPPPRQP